jgi:putative peptidoglycan lipid II flippase
VLRTVQRGERGDRELRRDVAAGVGAPARRAPAPGGPPPGGAPGDHDPPPGDGRERRDDVDNAIDGDLDTFWPTESYNTADLGGLKDGVGVWIELEGTSSLSHVEVTLSRDGGELELWVGDGPPDGDQQPDDWGTLVGQGRIEADDVRFPDLPRGTDGDTILLWFTELPPGGTGFRAEVRDVRIYGR